MNAHFLTGCLLHKVIVYVSGAMLPLNGKAVMLFHDIDVYFTSCLLAFNKQSGGKKNWFFFLCQKMHSLKVRLAWRLIKCVLSTAECTMISYLMYFSDSPWESDHWWGCICKKYVPCMLRDAFVKSRYPVESSGTIPILTNHVKCLWFYLNLTTVKLCFWNHVVLGYLRDVMCVSFYSPGN